MKAQVAMEKCPRCGWWCLTRLCYHLGLWRMHCPTCRAWIDWWAC